jgi:transposase InsO family protein
MDFISDLPPVNGVDMVLVIVDHFSKMAHFVPCSKTISGKEIADLLLKSVVRLHSIPEDITFDQGPQFISHFWKQFLQILGTSLNLSLTYHPQTDGQTERVNKILEQYL